jgi:hypothetical protein
VVSIVARGRLEEVKKDKLICTSCGNEKDINREFYSSNSPFHKHTGKLHVCKQCFWNFIGEDIEKLKLSLRMIDKPFIVELLRSSRTEAEENGKNVIKLYMKNVGMPQYKTFTWDDSDFDSHKKSQTISKPDDETTIEENVEQLSSEEIRHMKSFWGKGYEIEDLIWLQTEYEDWVNRYECDSKGMETLIQEICKQQLDINLRRSNGEKVDQQLKTLQDLLGSSNLKPVQETGANAVEQETFGTLIKKFEKDKPIPEPDPMWRDVDGIGKYIRTFFFGHMAKAIGVENKFQSEYEEEFAKHTVSQEDYDDGDLDG